MAITTYSSQLAATIARLRRMLGDTASEDFEDLHLCNVIDDALAELEVSDYSTGYVIEDLNGEGDFTDGNGTRATISESDKIVITLKAQILIKYAEKDESDRDTISMAKDGLTVNTSSKSANHATSLEALEKRLSDLLWKLNGYDDIEGVRVE